MDYLELPAAELIERFAAGEPSPAGVSAAALAAAVAAGLIETAAQITLRKPRYGPFHARALEILARARSLRQSLQHAVSEDARLFQRVVEARRARDSASSPEEARQHAMDARRALKPCAALPLQAAGECLELAGFGLELARDGFRGTRGDAAMAALSALASADGCLFAVQLNVQGLDDPQWAGGMLETAARLAVSLRQLRERLTAELTPPAET